MKNHNSFKSYQKSSKSITVNKKLVIKLMIKVMLKLDFVVNLELNIINFKILSILNTNNPFNTLNSCPVKNKKQNNSINFFSLN